MTKLDDTPAPQSDSQVPSGWQEALEQGRADVAAGRTYDADAFLAELEAEDASWAAEAALSQRDPIR